MENNTPEHNLEAEQGVLGALFQLGDYQGEAFQRTISYLKTASFYTRSHKMIYESIKKVGSRDGRIDLMTVSDYLEKEKNLDSAGGFIYLAELMKWTPSPANIKAHSRIVRETAIHRFSVDKMQNVIAMMNDHSNGDVYQRLGMLETTISEIMNMGMRNEKGGLKHITEACGSWLDDIEERQKGEPDKNKFTSGIEGLDDVLGVKGIRRGGLYVIGARPKTGKSALMTLMANHFALDLNVPVATFSMEMPNVEIWERSITSRTHVDPAEFYRKTGFTDETNGRLDAGMNEFIGSNYYIDDCSGVTVQHIVNECRKLRKEKGELGLVCVDYLTLMEAPKADRNDLAYGHITKKLKEMAKELGCVVLLLTQLNRGLESRPDKRPMPSDSKDTGQIEQDCDGWIGLYKESVYDENVSHQGMTEVIVRLNRHGGSGTAFADMKQGFLVPLTREEGAQIKHEREAIKKESEPQVTYKRK